MYAPLRENAKKEKYILGVETGDNREPHLKRDPFKVFLSIR